MYAFATLAAVATAAASDFPRFDSMHAHCQMNVKFVYTSCAVLYAELDDEIRSWANGDPSNGLMAVKEEELYTYIWSTRTTPVAHYIDDQIFELTQNGHDCDVLAKSRSQTTSLYDYDTNYCNMWNVLNSIGGMTSLTTKDCAWVPDSAVETCAIY